MSVCAYVGECMCVRASVCASESVCVSVSVRTCICVCILVNIQDIHAHTYTRTHTHTHTLTQTHSRTINLQDVLLFVYDAVVEGRGGGLGSSTISKNLMGPTPRRRAH